VSRTGPHAGLLTSSLAILATADRNHIKEKTMRFMLIVYPKIYETAQAGWLPDLDDESAENYAEELQKAGVLVALTGLTPPATMSARLTVENGMMKVVDGPFPEAKEVIGGIWIIDVQSRDEALKYASRIPGPGSETVEVRRLFDPSDFGPEMQKKFAEAGAKMGAL
jgi:hypothetical protein